MSDPNEENRTEQQRWPPPPIQNDADAPPDERSQALFNRLQIFKGFGLGIGVGAVLSLIAAILSGVAYDIWTGIGATCSPIVLAVPLIPEFFIARWLCRNQKTLGWTFGIVSATLSVLIGIALLELLDAVIGPDRAV